MCESPSDYRWTSSTLYTSGRSQESFVDPQPLLQLIDEDESTARKEYAQLLQQACGIEPDNALEQEGAIERFCVRLAEKFPALFGRLGGKGKQTNAQIPPLLELTQLERLLQEASGDRSRKPESRQAKKYVIQQLLARGYKKTEIAARLGISRKSVYNILTQS